MTIIEFFYPSQYEINMFGPYKGLPNYKAMAIGRIIQLVISILIFVQQGIVAHRLNESKIQEYLMLAFYSQIFQFVSYALLIVEAFAFPQSTGKGSAYQRTKHTHIITLIAHALYEISWVGFYIGVIQFLVVLVPILHGLSTGCEFYLCNLHIIFFVLMTVDLSFSRIHFIVAHIIYGLVWMTIWDIFSCALSNSYKSLMFGDKFAYCLALDFLFASFFFLATSYQSWKLSKPSTIAEVGYEEIHAADNTAPAPKTYEEVLMKIGNNAEADKEVTDLPKENETKI